MPALGTRIECSAAPWMASRAEPPSLHLHPPHAATRADVQQYIQQRYARAYDASLTEWMPMLVTLEQDEQPVAAAGYRDGRDRLFLERYLSRPIERCFGAGVDRSQIVEAGQFAAARAGSGRALIAPLTRHLIDAGYVWIVMTVTRELRHLFERMGLQGRLLARADVAALSPAERLAWGRYYDHEPMVIGGRLDDVAERLDR